MSNSKVVVKINMQTMFIMSDHYTRCKHAKIEYPCGILLGNISGNLIEINDAYELFITKDSEHNFDIDQDACKTIFDIKSKVFNFMKIGWFICKNVSDEEMEKIGKAIESSEDIDGFIRVCFNSENNNNQLLNMKIRKGDTYINSNYIYESELSERIVLNQIQSQRTQESNFEYLKQSYKGLDNKMKVIESYLDKSIKGDIDFEPETIRKINDLNLYFKQNNYKKTFATEINEQGNLTLMCGLIMEEIGRSIKKRKQ